MKRMICVLLLVFFVASFVVAVSSEVSTNFVVEKNSGDVVDYVARGGFWNNYGDYVVGALIVLIIGWIVFKRVGKGGKK